MKRVIFLAIVLSSLHGLWAVSGHGFLRNGGAVEVIIDDFQVNDDTTDCHQCYPSVAANGAGGFVIVWEDGRNGEKDIYAQRFDSDGSRLGTNFRVNEDTSGQSQLNPDVAMRVDGDFIVVWQDRRDGHWDIYAQRYDSSGEAQGWNFRADDDTTGALQFFPAISVDYGGSFVIGWDDYRNPNSDIYAQRYDSNGQPQGENFRVNDDSPASAQGQCDVVADTAGNFVLAWMDYRSGRLNIYAQRYNSSGETQGANFKVNDGPDNARQYDPAISADAAGNFVIVWEDERDGYDIFGQRFDSDGSKLGSNFKVNDDTTGATQGAPSIGIGDPGEFVIVWEDDRNGDWDVFAQRYDQNGDLVDVNFRLTNTSDNAQNCPAAALWNDSIYSTWMDKRTGPYRIWANALKFTLPGSGVQDVGLDSVALSSFFLNAPYPNPFNSAAMIEYRVPVHARVWLRIYDVTGSLVATLTDGAEESGYHCTSWDGRDDSGREVPAGVYFCEMVAGAHTASTKFLILR